tara:strand:+ start:263 stop:373 length:111 start_codon:yes stop_codon:yes gene_type:complete
MNTQTRRRIFRALFSGYASPYYTPNRRDEEKKNEEI